MAGRRTRGVVAALALACAWALGAVPRAALAEGEKAIGGLGTQGIAAPTAPADANSAWTGDHVWYGSYGGSPVLYRVLAPSTEAYGSATMLLDCDSILWK